MQLTLTETCSNKHLFSLRAGYSDKWQKPLEMQQSSVVIINKEKYIIICDWNKIKNKYKNKHKTKNLGKMEKTMLPWQLTKINTFKLNH